MRSCGVNIYAVVVARQASSSVVEGFIVMYLTTLMCRVMVDYSDLIRISL